MSQWYEQSKKDLSLSLDDSRKNNGDDLHIWFASYEDGNHYITIPVADVISFLKDNGKLNGHD